MSSEQPRGKTVNEGGSSGHKDAPVTQPRSGPVRYQLIDKDGLSVCDWGLSTRTFETASAAAEEARRRWPDQEQDPDRTGAGWDVQQMGAE